MGGTEEEKPFGEGKKELAVPLALCSLVGGGALANIWPWLLFSLPTCHTTMVETERWKDTPLQTAVGCISGRDWYWFSGQSCAGFGLQWLCWTTTAGSTPRQGKPSSDSQVQQLHKSSLFCLSLILLTTLIASKKQQCDRLFLVYVSQILKLRILDIIYFICHILWGFFFSISITSTLLKKRASCDVVQ